MSEDRRYPEEYAKNARKVLGHFVREAGTQEAAAEKLGVKQASVSRALQDAGQPTVKLLIALREKTGLTLDEMLGLPPIALRGADSNEEFIDRLRTLLRVLEAQTSPAQVKSARSSSRAGRK